MTLVREIMIKRLEMRVKFRGKKTELENEVSATNPREKKTYDSTLSL